jgi:hypothetical protein
MAKAKEGKEQKNSKKEAVMTLKEKRASKKAKRDEKNDSSEI